VSYWSRSFPGLAECLAEVRQFTQMVLGDGPGSDLVVLAVSELAGNAIVHTASGEPGGQFVVHLAAFADRWQVRVDDQGAPGDPRIVVPGVNGSGRHGAGGGGGGGGSGSGSDVESCDRLDPDRYPGSDLDSGLDSGLDGGLDGGPDSDFDLDGDLDLDGDWGAEAGRGLALVAAVSQKWGVIGDCNARAVWAEIPYPVTNGKAVEAVMSGDMLDAFAAAAEALAGEAGMPGDEEDFDPTPDDDDSGSATEREAAGLPAAASVAGGALPLPSTRWRSRMPTDPKVADRYRRAATGAMFQRALIEHAYLETIGPRQLPFWPPFPNPLALQGSRGGQARTLTAENSDDGRELEGQEAG
jgi:hypothetical protein